MLHLLQNHLVTHANALSSPRPTGSLGGKIGNLNFYKIVSFVQQNLRAADLRNGEGEVGRHEE